MILCMLTKFTFRKVHISEQTLKCLKGEYVVAKGNGAARSLYVKAKKMATYFVTKEKPRCSISYNRVNHMRMEVAFGCFIEGQSCQATVDAFFSS